MAEGRPDLDRLLEKGLEAWAAGEPEPGLEERIVERLRLEPSAPRPESGAPRARRTWRPILAAAAVILAAAGAAVFVGTRSKAPAPVAATNPAPTPLATAPSPASPEEAPSARETTHVVRATAPHRPRPAAVRRARVLPVFPSPAGISSQERLLLAYVRSTPYDEMKNHLGLLDAPADEPAGRSDTPETSDTKENR